MNENRCVVMFARYPEKGKVKSRLAPSMGDEKVLSLYRCFVQDLIDMLARGGFPFRIAYTPARKGAEMASSFGEEHVYLPQKGAGLGDRMKEAFLHCFGEGFSSVLLIGSDMPDLPRPILEAGFSALDTCDSVVGPSRDGGYYLIGFRRETFLPEVFDGIAWGTATVCRMTMEVLASRKSAVVVLPLRRDIDRPGDLKDFFMRKSRAGAVHSRTMQYLVNEKIY